MKALLSRVLEKLRTLFFPVEKSEIKLFLPLFLIFFFICFNYNALRTAKDTLIVTAPSSGAEALTFIKLWVILPMALVMTVLFTRLANRFTMEKVFYIMISLFLGFFVLFATVLYPLRDVLHPHAFADRLEGILPLGLKGLVALLRNWTYTVFYVMAELWGTTIMSVLFWGFANEILNVHTAKRFYVLILIGGNLSAIAAGSLSSFASNAGLEWGLVQGTDPWKYTLLLLSLVVIISGGLTVGVFRWFHKNVLGNASFAHQLIPEDSSQTFKMSLGKNFKYLLNSKYLLCIAAIVVAYNICINLTEVTWKDQLLHIYPNPNEFHAYMGQVTMWVGIVATTIALFSSTIIRKWSWTASAMIPPAILLVTGVGFFSFLLLKNASFGVQLAALLGSTPAVIGVFFGSLQHCFSRASKYTIFDATKELAFIPLSKESKLKGKAAIDGIGSRLGKSGSSVIYQLLLVAFQTVSATIPYVGGILLVAVAVWILGVYVLGKQFNALTEHQKSEEEEYVLPTATETELIAATSGPLEK